MEAIFKYPLKVLDSQVIRMPKGADILCVQIQNGVPCLWAIIDPSTTEIEPITIRTIGTGHSFDDGAELLYIGTYQLNNGALVFHVFENI